MFSPCHLSFLGFLSLFLRVLFPFTFVLRGQYDFTAPGSSRCETDRGEICRLLSYLCSGILGDMNVREGHQAMDFLPMVDDHCLS